VIGMRRGRMRCVHPADEHPRISINERGLVLANNSAGDWLIHGAADGLIYAAVDRLVWLLPLLERSPADVPALAPTGSKDEHRCPRCCGSR
jgi:hypothetical protein